MTIISDIVGTEGPLKAWAGPGDGAGSRHGRSRRRASEQSLLQGRKLSDNEIRLE